MGTLQKGFTLIELVIVMVILGILAAVAVPQFQDFSTDAEAAAVAGGISAVGSGLAIETAANKGAATVTSIASRIAATCSGGKIQIGSGTKKVVVTLSGITSSCSSTATGVTSGVYTA